MKTYSERLDLSFDPFAPYEHSEPSEPGLSDGGFFGGGNRQDLLERLLEQTLYGKSIMLVTGCLGSGKTILANRFGASFESEAVCAVVSATLFMNKTGFLQKLAEQLNIDGDDSAILLEAIVQLAASLELEARSLIVVVDDAHEMGSEVLEAVTGLPGAGAGIRLLLLGESQLGNMLTGALPDSFTENVMEFELDGMGGEDTIDYIRFKLAQAGFTGPLPLPGSVLDDIFNASNGIPGTINALVSDALEQIEYSGQDSKQADVAPVPIKRYGAMAAMLIFAILLAVQFLPQRTPADQLAAEFGDQSASRVQIPLPPPAATGATPPPDRQAATETINPAPVSTAATVAASATEPVEAATEATVVAVGEDSPVLSAGDVPAVAAQSSGAENHRLESSGAASSRQENSGTESSRQENSGAKNPGAANSVAEIAEVEGSGAENSRPQSSESESLEVENPEPEQAAIAVDTTVTSTRYSEYEQRLLNYPATSYTLQIMGSHSEQNVRQFIDGERRPGDYAYYETRFRERPWFVVVSGNYSNREQAGQAIQDLSLSLRSLQPWVRTLGDIHSAIHDLKSAN